MEDELLRSFYDEIFNKDKGMPLKFDELTNKQKKEISKTLSFGCYRIQFKAKESYGAIN